MYDNRERKNIFTWKHVLTASSEYFETCTYCLSEEADVGFSKNWNPEKAPQTMLDDGPTTSPDLSSSASIIVEQKCQEIIFIDDLDFITMHNLVYYLYTTTRHLSMHDSDQNPSPYDISVLKGYPDEVDPFQLYIASNMHLEEFLEAQCFQYLVRTCTPENICDRPLNIAYRPYNRLIKEYLRFIVDNYYEVKFTKGWSRVYNDMASSSQDEIEFFSSLLLGISMSDAFTEEDSEDDEEGDSSANDDGGLMATMMA